MKFESRPVPVALRRMHEPPALDPVRLLDTARLGLLRGSNIPLVVDVLSDGLWWMRKSLSSGQWRDMISTARAHPVLGLIHENPFTRRSYHKPRGYAGDAPLIDMVCLSREMAEAQDVSSLGLSMFERDANMPCAVALRERRDFAAGLIDDVTAVVSKPHVLAAACGHLREGFISAAIQERRIGRLVALDQDAEALEVVAHDFGMAGVQTVVGEMSAIMDSTFAPESFDLIYTNGMYDYLLQPFASGLTRAFFDLLRPGGRLVIPNFARGAYDAGYFETFADWFMVYRDAAEMFDLASKIEDKNILMKRLYTRQSPEIFYLEIRKKGIFAP